MYYLCEKYYNLITVQYCIDDCVSWVPRLTLLGLGTNWTYKMHSRNGTRSYVGDLLYFDTAALGNYNRSLTELMIQQAKKLM